MINRIPRSLLIFIFIVPLIFFLESKLLAPHLRYGFADVDWGYLYQYKMLGEAPFSKFYEAWKGSGVYTYGAYYMGILEHFFPIDGFNFIGIHQANHFFKFLSAITLFPLILVFTGKRLLAALTAILYAVASSTVAPLYSAQVSGYYIGITVMNLFATYYIFITKNNKIGLLWLIFGVLLFVMTLFIATERMYPLIPLIFLGEFLWMLSQKFSRSIVRFSIIRQIAFFSPLILVLLLQLYGGSVKFGGISSFFINTKTIFQKILEGNWQLALNPLISLASLFFPREYWGLIGSDRYALSGFGEYLGFLLGPFLAFLIFTSFLSFLILKKRQRFILLNFILAITLSIVVYILASHQLSIAEALRLSYDTMFLRPTIIGAFIISLVIALLIEWLLNGKKLGYLLYLFIGPAIAFLIIFLTWLPSDYTLIVAGVHRYLAIAAIASSFFIAVLITLFYEKINKIKALRIFSWLILLIIIPIIQLNFFVVGKYFYDELNSTGMDGQQQKDMKSKLLSYMGDFDLKEPTLFYFDEEDIENGYFHETTIVAGFPTWIRFRGRSIPLDGMTPDYIRNHDLGSETNVYCTGVNVDCPGTLRSYVTLRNGEKGILYKNVFYSLNRFYAFRLKGRDVFNIKSEILQENGI
ncbi:hypothetical protein A3I48_00885 [Candidatus Daviesbacteria bacterium RIFCSPLOWO2_02_FULL_36_7]|uniref:Glycosyltransferase RgtA/B/C/D-like domain-containing protein n=1 Tax=Candidatus Daviesbacteria bacterium RIFCSPLOWO2_02_FULL_36_7 TaxID=1797792 RepID=A0A1F5MHJ0_9BACT|nr:MAG: hypothetical protein A3I48_00885 [Candidatus Daviesbacteria bacterium RIFCSPLOWO2_02_FULL_36_7]